VGNFVDLETVITLKNFFTNFGCSNFSNETISNFSSDFRLSYLLNTTIISLEQASLILLMATNLRIEAPLLNARLRKNYLFNNKQLLIYSFGLAVDYLTFPVKNIGNSLISLKNIFEGRNIVLKNIFLTTFVNASFLG